MSSSSSLSPHPAAKLTLSPFPSSPRLPSNASPRTPRTPIDTPITPQAANIKSQNPIVLPQNIASILHSQFNDYTLPTAKSSLSHHKPKSSFIVNSTLLHDKPLCYTTQADAAIQNCPSYSQQIDLLAMYFTKTSKKICLQQQKKESSTPKAAAYLASTIIATRVRLIYKWILENVTYDENGLLEGTQETDVKHVMRLRKAGPEGFANLFVKLCSMVGIEAIKIKGYAKGFTYVTGKTIRHVNHAWNAVKIAKTWYLLDILWSAGVMRGVHFERQFQTSHYFLTDPRHFILDHFPMNSKWQLLDPPITRQEWDQLVRPDFGAFQYDIQTTHRFAVIHCAESALVLPFYTTKMNAIQVLVSVQPEVDSSPEFFNEDKYVHVQRFEHGIKVWILLPFAGVYTMHLYVRDITQKNVKGDYIGAYTYHIVSRTHLDYDVGWLKANPLLSEYGGRVDYPLQEYLLRNTMERFRVVLPGFSSAAVNMGGGSKWVHLKPQEGNVYQLDVFIKANAAKSITLHGYSSTLDSWMVLASYHSCSEFPEASSGVKNIKWNKNLPFLLDSDDGVDYNSDEDINLDEREENTTPFVFPEKTEQFQIKLLSHPERRVKVDPKSAGVTIRLQCERDDVLLRPLKLQQFGTELSNNTTWIVRSGKMIYFKVVCPSVGRFLFPIEISNKVSAYEEPEFESVVGLEYEIDATDYEGAHKHDFCFPRVYNIFNDAKCILYSPFYKLLTGRTYAFKVKVPNADYVAIINSGQFTYLTRRSEDEAYSAEVTILDTDYPEVTLTARLNSDPPEEELTSFPRYLDFYVAREYHDDDIFQRTTINTPINMPQIYSQYVTISDPHYKLIECGVLEQKLVLFKINTTVHSLSSPRHGNVGHDNATSSAGAPPSNFFLEATLYDELREVPRATLVLHNEEKKEIAVLFMTPTDGQYYLKIRLITVENQEMTQYEGLSFWVQSGTPKKVKKRTPSKENQDTKVEKKERSASMPQHHPPSDIDGIPPLTFLDEVRASSPPTTVTVGDQEEAFISEVQKTHLDIVRDMHAQRRSNSVPHGELERSLAEERIRQVKAQNLNQNSWKNRMLSYGYVKVEGMAFYRPYVYYPLLSYMVRDQVHSIKISVHNTSSVVCCSHNEKYDTYQEFQSLENDDLKDPTLWYGEASFSAPATEVLVMACVDPTHYCPIASYKLVDGAQRRNVEVPIV